MDGGRVAEAKPTLGEYRHRTRLHVLFVFPVCWNVSPSCTFYRLTDVPVLLVGAACWPILEAAGCQYVDASLCDAERAGPLGNLRTEERAR